MRRGRVVPRDPPVEFARQPADDLLVADVGLSEAAGGESALARGRFDDDDGPAHRLRLDAGDDAGAGAAIDDEVAFDRLGGEGGCGEEQGDGKRSGAHGAGESPQGYARETGRAIPPCSREEALHFPHRAEEGLDVVVVVVEGERRRAPSRAP